MRVAIIIPSFNEEKNITKTLHNLKKFPNIIVIDDGSTDKTNKKISKYSNVNIIKHKKNLGYEKSLESGFLKALELNMEAVITFDADGQHDYSKIDKIISLLEDFDLIIGTRKKNQRLSEYLFNLYINFRFGIKDLLCGLKGYKISLFIDYKNFDNFNLIGTELSLYALKNKYKFKTIEIPISKREDKPRFGSQLLSNYKIIKALILFIFLDLKN